MLPQYIFCRGLGQKLNYVLPEFNLGGQQFFSYVSKVVKTKVTYIFHCSQKCTAASACWALKNSDLFVCFDVSPHVIFLCLAFLLLLSSGPCHCHSPCDRILLSTYHGDTLSDIIFGNLSSPYCGSIICSETHMRVVWKKKIQSTGKEKKNGWKSCLGNLVWL